MNWIGWALLSAFFAGLTAVLAKAGVRDLDSNVATAIRTSVVLVFSWMVASWSVAGKPWPDIDRRTWLMLGLSGLATGLSWLCYFRALQLGPVAKVAPIDKLSVVFALVLAAWFLGERLEPRTLLGGGLIVAGALVLAWK